MHPHAFPNESACETEHGRFKSGQAVMVDGRPATLDEVLPDGEAFITFNDGTPATVKWNQLRASRANA